MIAYAIYSGTRFMRYVQAIPGDNGREQAHAYAHRVYGQDAYATYPDSSHTGAGKDRYGFWAWNAPSVERLSRH